MQLKDVVRLNQKIHWKLPSPGLRCAFLILFIITINVDISAQLKRVSDIGLKFGFNHSVIDGDTPEGDPSGYIGYEVYGSLFMDYTINRSWDIQGDLLISYTDDILMLEIPVRVKIRSWNYLYVLAGPKLDIIFDGIFDAQYDFAGVSLDAGFQYDVWKDFLFEFRFSYGITRQINSSFDFEDANRTTYRLGMGYRIPNYRRLFGWD